MKMWDKPVGYIIYLQSRLKIALFSSLKQSTEQQTRDVITTGDLKSVLLLLGCFIIYTKYNIPNKGVKTWQ